MAQFQTTENFVDGQLVTGNRMNNIVGQATALGGLITEQPEHGSGPINTNTLLIHAGGFLRKITCQTFFDAPTIDIKAQSVAADTITSSEGAVLAVRAQQAPLADPPDLQLGDVLTQANIIISPNALNPSVPTIQVTANHVDFATPGVKVDIPGTLTLTSSKHVTIPSGSTGQRPSAPGDVMLSGMLRYNTSLQRLEYYSGTAWNSVPTASDIPYKTYSKQVTGAPGVGDWVSAENTWQWRTSADVTVPAGEVWEYTVWVSGGSYGWGNTRPEYNHHARLYIGDTIARDVQCRISSYSGQWFAVLKINVTSADTSPAKKIGLKFVKGGGVGGAVIRSGAEGLQIVTSLAKRKSADDTEIGLVL